MTLHSLTLQRARRQLAVFCAARRPPGTNAPRWCLSEQNGALLVEVCGGEALLRLAPQPGGWLVSVPGGDGGWRPYPPLPVAPSIDRVLAELEQAPLQVHW